MIYSEVIFNLATTEDFHKDLLINSLSEIGFDTFEDFEPGFKAYIPLSEFNTDAIEQLLKDGLRVGVSEVPGWWFDTGNPASFLECNTKVLEAGVTNSFNSTPDVLIIEPCAIDPSATLSNCTIGPNVSVGAAVSVNGSTISNSVLLEQSSISGLGAITDSIVGKRSSIKTLPNTVSRVILGDDCDVEVGS